MNDSSSTECSKRNLPCVNRASWMASSRPRVDVGLPSTGTRILLYMTRLANVFVSPLHSRLGDALDSPPMDEPRYAWVVVWGAFFSLAVIFGVSYSFASFFESFAREFGARRAEVALAFGLCGLIYFLLGAGAGMLADRFGPR